MAGKLNRDRGRDLLNTVGQSDGSAQEQTTSPSHRLRSTGTETVRPFLHSFSMSAPRMNLVATATIFAFPVQVAGIGAICQGSPLRPKVAVFRPTMKSAFISTTVHCRPSPRTIFKASIGTLDTMALLVQRRLVKLASTVMRLTGMEATITLISTGRCASILTRRMPRRPALVNHRSLAAQGDMLQ